MAITHAYSDQVVSGVDPVTIRAKLKAALPRAPQKQLVRTKYTSFYVLSILCILLMNYAIACLIVLHVKIGTFFW